MEGDKKIDEPATEQPVEEGENAEVEKKKKKKKNKNKNKGAAEGGDYDAQLDKVCEEQKVEEEAAIMFLKTHVPRRTTMKLDA